MQYSDYLNTKKTPQSEPIPGSTQVANNAGGFAWEVDDWTRLNRFLILGAEGGTYYVKERKLVKDNAEAVIRCIQADAPRVAATTMIISQEGRAPKNDAAIFVLALGCAFAADKKIFYNIIPHVCRTGTHLFQFCQSIQDLRGWSRGLRRGVADWYVKKTWDNLEYQLLKYKQRNGWTHRDVLRLCHAKAPGEEHNNLMRHAVGKPVEVLPARTDAVQSLHSGKLPAAHIVEIVKEHKLTREMIPTEFMKSPAMWDALMHGMPITAAIRSLGQMTACGFLINDSPATRYLCDLVTNDEALKRGRVHPIAILNALKTYAQGRGEKGSLTWSPVPSIINALDQAFHKSFKAVEPAGKRFMLGLDVSPSMYGTPIAGTALNAGVAAGAMAMITARTEPDCKIMTFTNTPHHVNVKADATLNQVIQGFEAFKNHFAGTDCALPILFADANGWVIDTFVIYTDSETWAGRVHPSQALKTYRKKFNVDSKMIVVAMAGNEFTIADPNDKGMLDVVGFDTSTPQVMTDFARS